MPLPSVLNCHHCDKEFTSSIPKQYCSDICASDASRGLPPPLTYSPPPSSAAVDSISFTVPGQPCGKERARTVIQNGKARSYTPSKTKNYEAKVAMFALDAMKQAGWSTLEGPVGIEIASYKLIPQSRRKNLVEGQPCPEKPDHDNIAKAVCDALNYAQAAVYNDDSQIVDCRSRKYWGSTPRVEVKITRF